MNYILKMSETASNTDEIEIYGEDYSDGSQSDEIDEQFETDENEKLAASFIKYPLLCMIAKNTGTPLPLHSETNKAMIEGPDKFYEVCLRLSHVTDVCPNVEILQSLHEDGANAIRQGCMHIINSVHIGYHKVFSDAKVDSKLIYEPQTSTFYVNYMDPYRVMVVINCIDKESVDRSNLCDENLQPLD